MHSYLLLDTICYEDYLFDFRVLKPKCGGKIHLLKRFLTLQAIFQHKRVDFANDSKRKSHRRANESKKTPKIKRLTFNLKKTTPAIFSMTSYALGMCFS